MVNKFVWIIHFFEYIIQNKLLKALGKWMMPLRKAGLFIIQLNDPLYSNNSKYSNKKCLESEWCLWARSCSFQLLVEKSQPYYSVEEFELLKKNAIIQLNYIELAFLKGTIRGLFACQAFYIRIFGIILIKWIIQLNLIGWLFSKVPFVCQALYIRIVWIIRIKRIIQQTFRAGFPQRHHSFAKRFIFQIVWIIWRVCTA